MASLRVHKNSPFEVIFLFYRLCTVHALYYPVVSRQKDQQLYPYRVVEVCQDEVSFRRFENNVIILIFSVLFRKIFKLIKKSAIFSLF